MEGVRGVESHRAADAALPELVAFGAIASDWTEAGAERAGEDVNAAIGGIVHLNAGFGRAALDLASPDEFAIGGIFEGDGVEAVAVFIHAAAAHVDRAGNGEGAIVSGVDGAGAESGGSGLAPDFLAGRGIELGDDRRTRFRAGEE